MSAAEPRVEPADLPPPRVALVTGSNGFVGSVLCRALGEAGLQVRGIGRRDAGPQTAEIDYYRGDLLDAAALRPALAGADTVVHLAARVHVMRDAAQDPLREFRRVNVEGTRTLLEEASRAGVTRFVFASTVKAVGEASTVPMTVETPPRPVDPYGVSKLEAEELIRATAERRTLRATILRLPLLYGPRMKGNMLSLFRLVERGVPLPLGLVRNRRSMAFVGNAAAAVLAVLGSPSASSQTFFVSDGRDLSTPELIRLIAGALGREARLLPIPPLLFRVAGRAGDMVSGLRPTPLTSAAVDRLLGSLTVDSSAITRALGFSPPYSVEEGLRLTAEWFRHRNRGRK
jgi:nucleoside-diphosphate-sugar epimerase